MLLIKAIAVLRYSNGSVVSGMRTIDLFSCQIITGVLCSEHDILEGGTQNTRVSSGGREARRICGQVPCHQRQDQQSLGYLSGRLEETVGCKTAFKCHVQWTAFWNKE